MKYRADIDGLRAIAVLIVVIFHLDVPGFQGGYVGVDIFFVISGYLITSIIKNKYENREFELVDFYARRIRRLVPPLIVTIAFTLLCAAFILTPYDMVSFSRSATAALFSLSNIVFYYEAGYWDTASELKPLLHTWSLGVEEQFYLFWPAVIIGLLSIRRFFSFGASLALISLLGAALCIWYTGIDQSAAFYLLPFRVFQFSIGALIIPLTATTQAGAKKFSYRIHALAFWLGMLCIAISVSAFGADIVFPGWAVLVPTIGAALVLLSGARSGQINAAARVLMKNPVSIWLGRVSYSMYLVHWPIISLFRYQYRLELTSTDQLFLGVCILLATCALHYGIERRFYQREAGGGNNFFAPSGKHFVLRTMVVAGLLALVATSAWKGNGWSWRFPMERITIEQLRQGWHDRFKKYDNACSIMDYRSNGACNPNAGTQVLVVGNSHEVDGYNFINAGFGDDESVNLIVFGRPNPCIKTIEKNGSSLTKDKDCQERLDKLFDPSMANRIDIVLYAALKPYAPNNEAFLIIFQRLKELNPKIKLVTYGGYIVTKKQCHIYIGKTNNSYACALPENVEYFDDELVGGPFLKKFKTIEAFYIDRVDILCKNRTLTTCLTKTNDGIPAFYDKSHLSLEFAEMSGRMYAEKHPNLLHKLEAP